MDHARFWSLIDAARKTKDTVRALDRSLAALPEPELALFDGWLHAYLDATRREDLWAAVYLIRGGCSDDSFDSFRGWLVAQGEAVLLGAIRDPESLGGRGRAMTDERVLGVARRVYEQEFGPMPDAPIVEIPGASSWPADRFPRGAKWDRAFYAAHYPRLWEQHAFADPIDGAITRERFWQLVDGARAARREPTTASQFAQLVDDLSQSSIEEAIGFGRWMSGYVHALRRNDLRAACRILVGDSHVLAFSAFVGWITLGGEAFVDAAVRDPDALPAPEPCASMIHISDHVGRRRQTYLTPGEPETIPESARWPVDDAEVAGGRYTPDALRARFPRLTRGRSDETLTGPHHVDALAPADRAQQAKDLLARCNTLDDAAALPLLEEAVRMMPSAIDTRAARARVYVKLGRVEEASEDLEIGLRAAPRASIARFDHARVLLTLGRRGDAIAAAKLALQHGHRPAEAWLAEHTREAPPQRVRHAKFGEGDVVSVEGTGDQTKLVVDFASGRKTLLRRFVVVIG